MITTLEKQVPQSHVNLQNKMCNRLVLEVIEQIPAWQRQGFLLQTKAVIKYFSCFPSHNFVFLFRLIRIQIEGIADF